MSNTISKNPIIDPSTIKVDQSTKPQFKDGGIKDALQANKSQQLLKRSSQRKGNFSDEYDGTHTLYRF